MVAQRISWRHDTAASMKAKSAPCLSPFLHLHSFHCVMWWVISVTAAIWALYEPSTLRNVACCLVIWWIQGGLAAFGMLGILLLIALIKMLHADATKTHYSRHVPSTNVAPTNSYQLPTETLSPEALQLLHQLLLYASTYQSQGHATPKALLIPSRTSYYKEAARAKTSQREIEGDWDLHQAVLWQVGHRYQYDAQMSLAKFSATRSVFGVFKCYKCKTPYYDDPRVWSSSVICVQIWISHAGHYRTRLYSQQCLRCHTYVVPEPDKDDYVTKVVQVLDRWTGQNTPLKPLQYRSTTGPHMTDKCYACQQGVCPARPKV